MESIGRIENSKWAFDWLSLTLAELSSGKKRKSSSFWAVFLVAHCSPTLF